MLKYLLTKTIWALTNQSKCWQFKPAGTGQLSTLNHPYYLFRNLGTPGDARDILTGCLALTTESQHYGRVSSFTYRHGQK